MATQDQRVAQQSITPPQFVPPLLNEDEKAFAKGFAQGVYDQLTPPSFVGNVLSPLFPTSMAKNAYSGAQMLGQFSPIQNLISPFSPQTIYGNVTAAGQAFNQAMTGLRGMPLISRTQSPRGENVDIRTSNMEEFPIGEPTRLALQQADWRRQGQSQLAQQDAARKARIAAYDRGQEAQRTAIDAQYNKSMAIPLANAAQAGDPRFQAPWQSSMMAKDRPISAFFQSPMAFGGPQYSMTNLPVVAPTYRLSGGGTVQGWSDKVGQVASALNDRYAQKRAETAGLRQNWAKFWAGRKEQQNAQEAASQNKSREIRAARAEREAESIMARSKGKFSEQASQRAREKMLEAAQIRSGAFGEEAFMASLGGQQAAPYRFDVASGRFVATSEANAQQAQAQRSATASQKAARQKAELDKYLAARGVFAPSAPPQSSPYMTTGAWSGNITETPAFVQGQLGTYTTGV